MYSFNDSKKYWLKANISVLAFVATLLVNYADWELNLLYVMVITVILEIFVVLLSWIRGFHTKKATKYTRERSYETNGLDTCIGIIVFGFLFAFAMFVGVAGDIFPAPSFLIILMGVPQLLAAFFALLLPTVIIYLYDANVIHHNGSVIDLVFKYVHIFLFGVTVEVLRVLARMPFILQRLTTLIYILVVLFVMGSTLFLFDV